MKKGKIKFKSFEEVLDDYVGGDKKKELAIEVEKARLSISEKLVETREKMGFTQAELAKKMHVSQQLVSRIEGGSDNLTLETLVKFFLILGMALKVEIEKRKGHQQVLQFV